MLCYINNKYIFCLLFLLLFNTSITKANIQDKTDYTNIDNIINQYNKLKKNDFKSENKEKIYIFISFSMPDNLIKNYFLESHYLNENKSINTIFVLRGFYKNSFKETTRKVATLTQNNNNKQLGIIVDPLLFKKYKVIEVPTIVKEYEDYTYDKIVGAVSIKYSLEKFSEGKND